jgi:hypothetical protein
MQTPTTHHNTNPNVGVGPTQTPTTHPNTNPNVGVGPMPAMAPPMPAMAPPMPAVAPGYPSISPVASTNRSRMVGNLRRQSQADLRFGRRNLEAGLAFVPTPTLELV